MVKPPPRLVNPYVPDLKLRSWPSSSSAHDDDGHVLLQERTADDEEGQQQQQQPQPQPNRGRSSNNDELRPIRLQTSSSSSSESVSAAAANRSSGSTSTSSNTNTTSTTTGGGGGWAKVSMGSTTILCHVHAPVPIASLHSTSGAATSYYDGSSSNGMDDDNTIMNTGILAIHVHLAPHLQISFSSTGSATSATRQFERSLERQVHQALLPSVPLRQYAKCAIVVEITVVSTGDMSGSGLNGNGSSSSRLLVPTVLASTLALMDAHVELYDIVTCGRIALVVNQTHYDKQKLVEMVVDPDLPDEERAMIVITIATMSSWKEITYWNQQSVRHFAGTEQLDLDPALVNDAVECCLNVCKTIRKLAVRHLHRQQPQSG